MFEDSLKDLMNEVSRKFADDDPEDVMDFIQTRVLTFPKYMEAVVHHVITIEGNASMMAGGIIDVEAFQERNKSADESRRLAHNVAMSAMDQLNRLCDNVGKKHICPDETDRLIRADFAAAVTMEMFMSGTKTSGTENEYACALDQMMKKVESGSVIYSDASRIPG